MKSPKVPKPEPPAPPVSQRAGEVEATERDEMLRRRNRSAFQNTILRSPMGGEQSGSSTLGY